MASRAKVPAVRTPPASRPAPPVDGPLRASVRAAVDAHPADPAAVLAMHYAGLLDASVVIATQAEAPALGLSVAIGAANDLGPKLLATLDALLLTPRSLAAMRRGVTEGTANGAEDELDELRRRRAARAVG